MPWWADALISTAVALVLLWLALVVVLWRTGRGVTGLADSARLLPDVIRLVSRLARDLSLPRRIRARLWLLLAYLTTPIDLVPDFVPVVGYADDAIVVALTLRSVLRAAGPAPVERHWPGSPAGLALVLRLAGSTACRRPPTG